MPRQTRRNTKAKNKQLSTELEPLSLLVLFLCLAMIWIWSPSFNKHLLNYFKELLKSVIEKSQASSSDVKLKYQRERKENLDEKEKQN